MAAIACQLKFPCVARGPVSLQHHIIPRPQTIIIKTNQNSLSVYILRAYMHKNNKGKDKDTIKYKACDFQKDKIGRAHV